MFRHRTSILCCLIVAVAFLSGWFDRGCCCAGTAENYFPTRAAEVRRLDEESLQVRPACCAARKGRTGGVRLIATPKRTAELSVTHRCRCHHESRPADGRLRPTDRVEVVGASGPSDLGGVLPQTASTLPLVARQVRVLWSALGPPPRVPACRLAQFCRWSCETPRVSDLNSVYPVS